MKCVILASLSPANYKGRGNEPRPIFYFGLVCFALVFRSSLGVRDSSP